MNPNTQQSALAQAQAAVQQQMAQQQQGGQQATQQPYGGQQPQQNGMAAFMNNVSQNPQVQNALQQIGHFLGVIGHPLAQQFQALHPTQQQGAAGVGEAGTALGQAAAQMQPAQNAQAIGGAGVQLPGQQQQQQPVQQQVQGQ